FLLNDMDGAASMVALDAKTGKPVWEKERPYYRACYSTPFVRQRPGEKPELLVASTAGLTAYSLDKGDANWGYKWTFDGMRLRTVASPVQAEGVIVANSGDGNGSRHLIAVRVDSAGQAELAWEKKSGTPYVPCVLALGEYVYAVNDAGVAACYKAKSGEEV